MIIGIVGSEAKKFTPLTEARARRVIRQQIAGASKVVSGACHLGGIDVWAIEEAKKLGIATEEFPPSTRTWEGYRTRNVKIAITAERVICIVPERLPDAYKGMTFELCYHCHRKDHVKSGGCWTMHYARRKLSKQTELFIIKETRDADVRKRTRQTDRGVRRADSDRWQKARVLSHRRTS